MSALREAAQQALEATAGPSCCATLAKRGQGVESMEAKQTPLIELLERVPQDARVVVEHDQFSSSSHPVGRLCHEAAAALRAALVQERATLDAAYQQWLQDSHAPALRRTDSQSAFAAGWHAALAQEQAEPEPKPMHPELRKMWEEHFDRCFRAMSLPAQERAEPLNLRDRAVQRRLAAQWGYVPAALAESSSLEPDIAKIVSDNLGKLYIEDPAEPAQEPVAWVASEDGCTIQDNCFTHDVVLRVSGDFEDDEQRSRYTQQIVDKLNASPPRRTMVPLTEEEIERIHLHLCHTVGSSYKTVARAIEKASWEKHHG